MNIESYLLILKVTISIIGEIIDACNDLSVQVHPNDEYAKAHENSLGKTECWYVLNTDEGTKW